MPIIMHPCTDSEPQARGTLFDTPPTMTAPPERHWFVDDPKAAGYCAACGLPAWNQRHVGRAR